ncbi:hypothetical protein ATANTOWER_016826 [Ataeniobius toweri]|uniref:C-type lectin domain-containing protein n=1 Tax=Ataeniobius toweri TaxID=208326 RepID=A0ABU7B0Q9_9TELE|nr:hypothetical protein [Ataeniobius toweri]
MALSRAAGSPFADDHSETKETLPEGSPVGMEENRSEATDLVKRHESCPYGWSQFKHRCYRYFSTPMTWARAERTCLSMQATLASVHSFEEYHHIQGVIKTVNLHTKQAWLGGSDAQEEGIWFWSDGSSFHFLNWCPGEPNNAGWQHCLQMNYGDLSCWDDVWCTAHRPFVCAKKI